MIYFIAGPIWRPENGRSFGFRSWVGGALKIVPRGRRSGVPAFSMDRYKIAFQLVLFMDGVAVNLSEPVLLGDLQYLDLWASFWAPDLGQTAGSKKVCAVLWPENGRPFFWWFGAKK